MLQRGGRQRGPAEGPADTSSRPRRALPSSLSTGNFPVSSTFVLEAVAAFLAIFSC